MIRAPRSAVLHGVEIVVREISEQRCSSFVEEGETYICPTCNQPVKPCEKYSMAKCELLLRGNTELDLLRSAMRAPQDVIGRCIECGDRIGRNLLAQNPLRELCSTCQSEAKKGRRRPSSSGV